MIKNGPKVLDRPESIGAEKDDLAKLKEGPEVKEPSTPESKKVEQIEDEELEGEIEQEGEKEQVIDKSPE